MWGVGGGGEGWLIGLEFNGPVYTVKVMSSFSLGSHFSLVGFVIYPVLVHILRKKLTIARGRARITVENIS